MKLCFYNLKCVFKSTHSLAFDYEDIVRDPALLPEVAAIADRFRRRLAERGMEYRRS